MAVAVSFLIVRLWKPRSFWQGRIGKIGCVVVVVTLVLDSTALMFQHGVFRARAWPVTGLFDQVIVTPAGHVFMNVNDPLGFGSRVQLYSCQGVFKAAFQPDNAGGSYKIGVNPDETLSIYNAKTRTIDTFRDDGAYVGQQKVGREQIPFDFDKSGPSVTAANGREILVDPYTRKLSVKDDKATRPLEAGEWILVYVVNSRNIALLILFGGLLGASTRLKASLAARER
ncbi:hypothetical protein M2418_003639 [Rhizobium sp. BIGb0125]|jgi:hypothetical protein|uniref:hypothetical protein n=1 Tax=Rhizobium sp. BIGb0125 TaxID=2940618 RepID=UPI0021681D8C|nr:hypothetical protein [Rhizobium sp. BIGb0125]MCS4244098.1 hypothetical protein [Rhizobium sp. BIGb0125]